MQNEVNVLYKKIQSILITLVPENWKTICLYASVINREMYFYYYPKKILKTNPINCYDIPKKFGIDEEQYNKELKKLYMYIQQTQSMTNDRWTNITILMENTFFTIEYHFNDLIHSKYTDEQRRIAWCYKYLKIPIESFNLKERLLIEGYKEEAPIKPYIYTENFPTISINHNYNDYNHKKIKRDEYVHESYDNDDNDNIVNKKIKKSKQIFDNDSAKNIINQILK